MSVEDNKAVRRKNFLPFCHRWIFLLSSTIIVVFFSEKMYWYIQGYSLLILILVYVVGVYIIVRAIEFFSVAKFWPFVLVAVLYPLYVEGLFTGIILQDITVFTMLSYFVGWHTLISVMIGWYLHRKWLINKDYFRLGLSSTLIGIFWGFWSIVYWTPRQMGPEFEDGFRTGQWPVLEFAFLVFFLTLLYIGSHYLLGRKGIWQSEFRPSKIEDGIIFAVILFFLIIQFIALSFLVLILLGHLCIVLLALRAYSRRKNGPTILKQLEGEVELKGTLVFFFMPLLATMVYWLFTLYRPSDEFIGSVIYDGTVFIQLILGFIFYLVAIFYTLRRAKKRS
ncbi:MAG: hypothetical protein R6U17_05290 [Thermoplasmata archaeon]